MKKCIIFDLDGTILYTLDDLMISTNHSLNKYGFDSITKEEVKKFIGNGIRKLVERALKNKNGNVDLIYNEFISFYKKNYSAHTYPYPYVFDMLKKLHDNNYKLCVLTNKADEIAIPLINDKFPNLFDLVIGDKKGRSKKPGLDGFNEILDKFNLDKKDVLYIGDSDTDIEFVNNAKIDSIIVSYGYRDYKDLVKLTDTIIAKTPQELEEKISIYLL